jgi:hypothetical protein
MDHAGSHLPSNSFATLPAISKSSLRLKMLGAFRMISSLTFFYYGFATENLPKKQNSHIMRFA